MKSSKDIEPRVGMQINHRCGVSAKIVSIDSHHDLDIHSPRCAVMCSDNRTHYLPQNEPTGEWATGEIEIEWIPPTDEERKMFVEAHDHIHARREEAGNHTEACSYLWECEHEVFGDIFLSLALDGADYDNMPEGFE